MLRRVANHLYWTARYLEHAEWRARLLDVNYHLLVESPAGPSGAWGAMLAITGHRGDFDSRYAADDEASVLAYYTFDDENPSSIRSCIGFARENCSALRHRISSELWLEINTLYLDTQRWSPAMFEAVGVYGFFSELRERFYRIAGVIQTTISRDVGFDFLAIGRSLECAENISRLLDVKYHVLLPKLEDVGSPLDLSQWAALLRSASALEAYRRSYGNLIRADKVVEVLLFDASFPRAARFCIDRMGSALGRVEAAGMHSNGT
ncbi:MAG: alpha-E domain-containing protein, partial [Candidatus Binataceae bacterium]